MRKIGWGSLAPMLIVVAMISGNFGVRVLKIFGIQLKIIVIPTITIINVALLCTAYYISCKYPKDFGAKIVRKCTAGIVLVGCTVLIGGLISAIIFTIV